MSRFEGKRILVTGGTSGIGLATAKRIVEEGGDVAVTGRSQDHLDIAGRELPPASLVLRNDASDPEAAKHLAEKVRDQMDGLDGLFLNAGYGKFLPIEEHDETFIDDMHQVNVRAPILQMAALKDLMNEGSSVLVTASVSPYLGMEGSTVYSATKAAVTAIVRTWAKELAPAGVRANSIAPGPIDTNFFEGMDLTQDEQEDFQEQVSSMLPLGRVGTPQEVAAVATFLLSEEASFVTGSQWMVDGGMALR